MKTFLRFTKFLKFPAKYFFSNKIYGNEQEEQATPEQEPGNKAKAMRTLAMNRIRIKYLDKSNDNFSNEQNKNKNPISR